MKTSIYVVCGGAHSNKSQFIAGVLQDDFADEQTLYLSAGDTPLALQNAGEKVSLAQLQPGQKILPVLRQEVAQTGAKQVILEIDENFDLENLFDICENVSDFEVYQVILISDADSFLNDAPLQAKLVSQMGFADMVVFNRCTPHTANLLRQKNVKLAAPDAVAYLEYENGDGEDYYDPDVFDFMSDSFNITVPDGQFGTFYGDFMDNAPEYVGKNVAFRAVVQPLDTGEFAAVRYYDTGDGEVLTLGIFCSCLGGVPIVAGQCYEIRGSVSIKECPLYEGEGPVVAIEGLSPAINLQPLFEF